MGKWEYWRGQLCRSRSSKTEYRSHAIGGLREARADPKAKRGPQANMVHQDPVGSQGGKGETKSLMYPTWRLVTGRSKDWW